jgi:hypothetical protein
LLILTGGLSVIFSFIVLWEPARQSVRARLQPWTRVVLAQAQGDLSGQGDLVTVLKVRELDSILLEVYENDSENRPVRFRNRVVISNSRDGAFQLQGQLVSLALLNVDQQPGDELIAPTFDYDFIPRLNIYKFDPNSGQFNSRPSDSFQL